MVKIVLWKIMIINYYNLSVFNYPYEVYLNDMKLEKEDDGNYTIYP